MVAYASVKCGDHGFILLAKKPWSFNLISLPLSMEQGVLFTVFLIVYNLYSATIEAEFHILRYIILPTLITGYDIFLFLKLVMLRRE